MKYWHSPSAASTNCKSSTPRPSQLLSENKSKHLVGLISPSTSAAMLPQCWKQALTSKDPSHEFLGNVNANIEGPPQVGQGKLVPIFETHSGLDPARGLPQPAAPLRNDFTATPAPRSRNLSSVAQSEMKHTPCTHMPMCKILQQSPCWRSSASSDW